MTLNPNRIIDGCGNTAANPYGKKCVTVQKVERNPEADFYFLCGLGAFVTIALVVVFVFFRNK